MDLQQVFGGMQKHLGLELDERLRISHLIPIVEKYEPGIRRCAFRDVFELFIPKRQLEALSPDKVVVLGMRASMYRNSGNGAVTVGIRDIYSSAISRTLQDVREWLISE